MPEIVIKKACYIAGKVAEVGDVVDVDIPTAAYLENIGRAERVPSEPDEAQKKPAAKRKAP